VTCDSCISDYYYKDQGVQGDWNCGDSTYNDHLGSDYSLRNGNFAIDSDNEVVAMAAGTVVSSEDGYYDRCTQCGGANCGYGFGNGFANQVIIDHGAYRVIYGHMKMGSIAVEAGDVVTCGQVIGFIGSSGCSTGAHLHVEPSPTSGGQRPAAVDPYEGDCSPTATSLWVEQGAYRTLPSISCDNEPPVPMCPAETYDIWTCNPDGMARRRCIEGVDMVDPCMWGCTSMPVGTDDVCAMPPDVDMDGSRADVDCDDANASRHPGAVETCGDGVDQDCSSADLACPTSGAAGAAGRGGAGGSGTVQPGTPAPAQGGAAAQPAAAGQGQVASPVVGQAGAAAIAGAPAPWPGVTRQAPDGGCRTAARDARRDSAFLAFIPIALALARLRRRAARSA
jgi:hypothetical protein